MKIIGTSILIEQIPSVEKTEGGIFIPQSAQRVDQEGIVSAIGSGIREALEFRKGSRVFIEMYKAATVVKHKEREYFLVDRDDVCGVLVGDKFHPVGERILLRPIKTVMRGGRIVRPSAYEDDKGDPVHCVVQALGSGIRNKKREVFPFDVSIGDEVIVMAFCGRDVDDANGTLKLVRQSDILCTVKHKQK